jgi:CYTH domain-containing protein
MATEIERKFLVTGTAWKQSPYTLLSQGYLNRAKERTVRIRVAGNQAFITVKGVTTGASRQEFEYEIPVFDAQQMLLLGERPIIEKRRYILEYEGLAWEIDEFLGDNQGLVIAEVELESEAQPFKRPAWLGLEVTDDHRYFNSSLTINPYGTWNASDST